MRKKSPYSNLALITQLALNILVPIFGGIFLGTWLDDKFNKVQLFKMIFLILGIVVGFLNLLKVGGRIDEDE